jgi:hypothetical protein
MKSNSVCRQVPESLGEGNGRLTKALLHEVPRVVGVDRPLNPGWSHLRSKKNMRVRPADEEPTDAA